MQTDVASMTEDSSAVAIVRSVARQQMKRRARAYHELAIFEYRDLSQELWCSLLVEEKRKRILHAFVCDDDSFREYVVSLSEVIAQRGMRKTKYGHSIPLSMLTKRDHSRLWHKKGESLEATFDELFEKQEYWS